jgi:hypothetical protein
MKSQFTRFIGGLLVVLAGFSTFALAGPPLICHVINIGQAQSLPLADWNYRSGNNYDLKNLTHDTLAILDSNPSVLVHMETLRRATIYARQDQLAAKELITRLHARAEDPGKNGELAWFDFGYLAEAYKQWMGLGGGPNPASGIDGYAWVEKAIRQRGSDAEMEFAAALITVTSQGRDHDEHLQRARNGAMLDELLAKNVESSFGK